MARYVIARQLLGESALSSVAKATTLHKGPTCLDIAEREGPSPSTVVLTLTIRSHVLTRLRLGPSALHHVDDRVTRPGRCPFAVAQ